jgi:predicted dienelactone hydrolase
MCIKVRPEGQGIFVVVEKLEMNQTKARLAAHLCYFCLCIVLCVPGTHAATTPATQPAALYKSAPGPWAVAIRDEEWLDGKRNRAIPVRIYIPSNSDAPTPRPLIIISHGWGGSRTTYRYFAEHLASYGYLVISPTHKGSDTAAALAGAIAGQNPAAGVRSAMLEGVNDPENLRNRPKDISFVIDEISRHPDLVKLVDLTHIGMAGHSFGAYTAMAIGGMSVDLPERKKTSLRDPRVKAVLPMSPQGSGFLGITPSAWDHFAVPVLFLTGTKDYGSGGRAATWRDEPFQAIHTAPEWIVTIIDATHMTFARPGTEAPLIDSLGTAFFDANVLDDAKAKDWMTDFFATKHDDCIIDHKSPTN